MWLVYGKMSKQCNWEMLKIQLVKCGSKAYDKTHFSENAFQSKANRSHGDSASNRVNKFEQVWDGRGPVGLSGGHMGQTNML